MTDAIETPGWARELLEGAYRSEVTFREPLDNWRFVRTDLDTYDDAFAFEQTGSIIPVAVFRSAGGGRLRLVAGPRYKVVGGEVVRVS